MKRKSSGCEFPYAETLRAAHDEPWSVHGERAMTIAGPVDCEAGTVPYGEPAQDCFRRGAAYGEAAEWLEDLSKLPEATGLPPVQAVGQPNTCTVRSLCPARA